MKNIAKPAVLAFAALAMSSAAAADDPPRIEVTESGNPMSKDAEAIEEGLRLYAKWCRQCHGPKADGVAPRFGKYSGDLRQFWRGYGEYVAIVFAGRPEKQMPPWAGVLTQTEVAQIGAYLETLAIDGANWR